MNASDFFGVQSGSDKFHWELPVRRELCSGMGALFGGSALGVAIATMEVSTQRSTVWASTQFLDYAPEGSVVELAINEEVRGHNTSQVRAIGTANGTEIFTTHAALGERETQWSGQWAIKPDVPNPNECPQRAQIPQYYGTIMDTIEIRLADARNMHELPGPPGDGTSALWVRLPDLEISPAALAIIGDFVPIGISQALGDFVGGNSLDNTIRVLDGNHPTEWVLADIRISGLAHGYGHGLVHLWAEDGVLLATASQSIVVRSWESYLRK